jgi:hypothetical protein
MYNEHHLVRSSIKVKGSLSDREKLIPPRVKLPLMLFQDTSTLISGESESNTAKASAPTVPILLEDIFRLVTDRLLPSASHRIFVFKLPSLVSKCICSSN